MELLTKNSKLPFEALLEKLNGLFHPAYLAFTQC